MLVDMILKQRQAVEDISSITRSNKNIGNNKKYDMNMIGNTEK